MNREVCFVNGLIRTMSESQPWAEAVVVRDRRITYVGGTEDVRSIAGGDADIIDLAGKLVLPGFADCHTHFVLGGTQLAGVQLRGCPSEEEFIVRIQRFAHARPGKWITGGTWDHEGWSSKRLPRREWIDPVTADNPVFVTRHDAHMGLANSLALRLAGITRDTPDPHGGRIERDPVTGEPTGILKDAAMDRLFATIPPPTEADVEQAVLRALEEARRAGITSIHDISDESHIPVFRKLEHEGRLTCRIYARLPIAGYETLIRQGIRHATGTPKLRLGSVKAFTDGSLGSSTALFFDPYQSDPSTSGLATDFLSNGTLQRWALDADVHQLQLSIHAIGDRANHLTLELFEQIVEQNPWWDRRFRIEHAQHVRAEDIARFARLNVIVSAQPYHCVDDGAWAAARLGTARCSEAYTFRSFLDAGVRVCFGSDWTVAPLDAILGISAAVTRQTLDGKNPEGWYPRQKLTVDEAVRCYTVQAAYAEFEEKSKGTIAPGMLADMVVLSRNIYDLPPDEIAQAMVEMTVFDGEVI